MLFESLDELVKHLRGQDRSITARQVKEVVDWQPPYDEHDARDVMNKLSNSRTTPLARYKKWAESNRERIRQKEDVLWSRKTYQKDLDRLADRLHIPRSGFSDDNSEGAFWHRLSSVGGSDAFKRELMRIVEKQSSSRLQLGPEWYWTVQRHLLRRSRFQARLMLEMMSPPQIDFDTDERGEPTRVYLTDIESNTPAVVIQEYKKDLKVLERDWGLKPHRRENISPKRERAKRLHAAPGRGTTLPGDKALRHRYEKSVED